MKRGIPAICLEQRYMGENSSDAEQNPDCYQPAMCALLKGRTILGERVFDVDRVIDYITERGDFDLSHVGVMGNSGGGTTSMFSGAVLTRLTHIMPSCSFSSFAESIGAMFHCSCNYVPGLYCYGESADVLGLIAPRPLVVVSGRRDDIFPLKPAQEQFARLEQIYASVGSTDHCRHVIGEGGHRFYAEPAWEAMLPLWSK
jgi:predicted dienelactone hydrolase